MIYQLLGFVIISNFLIDLTQSGRNDWLIYLNERRNVECFFNGGRYFCHSNEENVPFERTVNRNACVHGTPWSFVALKNDRITPEILIEWIIPFHLIEQYADYLNSSNQTSTGDILICNCTLKRFGTHCDYEIENKTEDLTKVMRAQRVRSADAYETLTSLIDEMPCNTSIPRVEWRQICDGIIHCENAIDEFGCHLLELNQCEEDEYRCRNGMCIPKESSFDSTFDCMDSSDEQELTSIFSVFDLCSDESKYDCDERLCRKDQFSCGDGQCVPWSAVINQDNGCKNFRHKAYRCDTTGTILSAPEKLTGICEETTEPLEALTNASSCVVSLRHFLTAHRQETLQMSMTNIIDNCSELIQYPEQAILFPGLVMLYNRSQFEVFSANGIDSNQKISRKPHLYCLRGKMTCDGELLKMHDDFCMTDNEFEELIFRYSFFPLSHIFCAIAAKQASCPQLPPTSGLYRCYNTCESISLHRVNDGYRDCLYGDDERNKKHSSIGPVRYRCETVPKPYQYVSYQQLGNGINECLDGSDEMSSLVRWSLIKCDIFQAYACWLFQNNERDMSSVVLPYYRHCDTFWDTVNGSDEKNCSEWICIPDDYQCQRTGQCISKSYRCDQEFDCSNGEDELNCPLKPRQWTKERDCHSKYEFFCITQNYLKDPKSERPCILATEIGDGHIDCLGARDERNIFACPDRQMLGDRFLCDNQTKCLNYTVLCNGIDDCLDQTDERICFWNRTGCLSEQFACFNGIECQNQRCYSINECSDKSNWFWCPNPTRSLTLNYRADKNHYNVSKHERFCYSQSSSPRVSSIVRKGQPSTPSILRGYCNRGFYLTGVNRSDLRCFCPPSYYGHRCQYDSRRVTVLVLFDRWHRLDIPVMINVLVTLIHNNSRVVDHQFLTDFTRDYVEKHHLYLLYPRPRPPGFYSVRFEAYDSLQLLAIWEYPISPLDFLPVFRLAKALQFPRSIPPDRCRENLCRNNGTCYTTNNNQPVCLCPREWHGQYCEAVSIPSKCAAHSLVRDEQICICPRGYLFPSCFVPNRKCDQPNIYSVDGECHPLSRQPPNLYRWYCDRVECSQRSGTLTIDRNQSNSLPFLFQLLKISSDYPVIRQQILIHPSTNFPIHKQIRLHVTGNLKESLPEIGLAFTFEPLKHTVNMILHLLYINCSRSNEKLSVILTFNFIDVGRSKIRELSSTKIPLTICTGSKDLLCFQWKNYVCYATDQRSTKRMYILSSTANVVFFLLQSRLMCSR